MISPYTEERDDAALDSSPEHLSHSRVMRYELCPEQYRLYYLKHLRPRIPSSSLVFGNVLHQALADFFRTQADPVKAFAATWSVLKGINLRYKERETWAKLQSSGEALLAKFVREEAPRVGTIRAVEKRFELAVSDLDYPVIGFIDLVTEFEGKRRGVVDFKTSASSYSPDEAALSDQLTAYALAEPDAERLSLCVLVKTKEPKIEWHHTSRSPAQLAEYLAKLGYVAEQITNGHFFKRPGAWCAWCDFRAICTGDMDRANRTLIAVP